VTVISVVGEVDASNSRHVALYVRNRLAECDYLGVDMGEVKFLGVSAISTLHCINVECAKRGIPWVLAPSAEVSRVLRICAPGCAFPLADDVTAGIAKLRQ
jgi:anti-anti-sigma factor